MKPIAFAPDQSASAVNSALKQSVRSMDQARHCAVLWFKEIVERKLFRELGYSSVYQYAEIELEFSKTRTGNFLQLARRLEKLPRLKREMESGGIGYTKALEVIKVADEKNEREWVARAQNQSRRQLRETVETARKQATSERQSDPNQGRLIPTASVATVATKHRLSFELTAEQLARYESLVERVRKRGAMADRAEMLLEALAALAADDASCEATTQIHVHHCPECEKATVATAKGDVELATEEFERLAEDAHIAQPGKRNRSTISPSTRRRVLARDRHRCRAPGCSSTRFLEIHHIVPRKQGGANTEENLITLCGACHRQAHRRPGIFPLQFSTQTEKLRPCAKR